MEANEALTKPVKYEAPYKDTAAPTEGFYSEYYKDNSGNIRSGTDIFLRIYGNAKKRGEEP